MDHPRLPELRESKPQTRLLLSYCSSAFEGWALGAALGAAPGCREERQPVRAPNVGTQTIAKIIGGYLFFLRCQILSCSVLHFPTAQSTSIQDSSCRANVRMILPLLRPHVAGAVAGMAVVVVAVVTEEIPADLIRSPLK